jgi:predicted XRE-type DNA-binding protein
MLCDTYMNEAAHDPGWPYLKSPLGYGRVWSDGAMLHAHQVACEMAHGPKPFRGAVVRHSCRNRACYYGPHLQWGTQEENNQDMFRDGTTAKGERNGMAKLTEIEVEMIRCLLEFGDFPQSAIADVFGVDQSNVSVIHRGASWSPCR